MRWGWITRKTNLLHNKRKKSNLYIVFFIFNLHVLSPTPFLRPERGGGLYQTVLGLVTEYFWLVTLSLPLAPGLVANFLNCTPLIHVYDWQSQRPFWTKTISYKGDLFVQKHRSHFVQGFFVRGGTWIFTYTCRVTWHHVHAYISYGIQRQWNNQFERSEGCVLKSWSKQTYM